MQLYLLNVLFLLFIAICGLVEKIRAYGFYEKFDALYLLIHKDYRTVDSYHEAELHRRSLNDFSCSILHFLTAILISSKNYRHIHRWMKVK